MSFKRSRTKWKDLFGRFQGKAVLLLVLIVLMFEVLIVITVTTHQTNRCGMNDWQKSFDDALNAFDQKERRKVKEHWMKNYPSGSDAGLKDLIIDGNQINLAHYDYKIVNGNEKFFKENPQNGHLDAEYGNKDLSIPEIYATLKELFIEFKTNFICKQNVTLPNIVPSLPLFWLDEGSLLGSYREGDIIAWDDDGDIGVFDFVLDQWPLEWETDTLIWKRNPGSNKFVYDWSNIVSARFISKENGVFLDVMGYSMVTDDNGIKWLYNKWTMSTFKMWQRLSDLLPITHTGSFMNDTYNIPRNTKQWLLTYYDSLERPS